MQSLDVLLLVMTILSVVVGCVVISLLVSLLRKDALRSRALLEQESRGQLLERSIDRTERALRDDVTTQGKTLREEVAQGLFRLQESLARGASDQQSAHLQQAQTLVVQMNTQLSAHVQDLGSRLETLTTEQRAQADRLRELVHDRLQAIQADNTLKLEQMRTTVDEKLQGTLEKRLGESFKVVSDRLEQVHKGLGEMTTLASQVGDLQKVLTNVKTRGTWGEVQLGALLEQVLTEEQFGRNVAVQPNASERVEFAVRLPLGSGDLVWLPIDSKFPQEPYLRLVDASDRGAVDDVEAALKALDLAIKLAAKDIFSKYVAPPHTTDFAIMFLPTEGLYAEVLRRPGLLETLQRDYRVVVAGPTTLLALLNSLQLGFRSLAIQRRSAEVWKVLGEVKTEFDRFGGVIEKVKKKLDEAQRAVDDVGIRRRAMERKLRDVQALPVAEPGANDADATDATDADDADADQGPATAQLQLGGRPPR